MKLRWLVVVCAGVSLLAAGPALAKQKKRYHKNYRISRQCVDRPASVSLGSILFNPHPSPNGCSPPVYSGGYYVGQDPDSFIRQQLQRDPETGYAYELAH